MTGFDASGRSVWINNSTDSLRANGDRTISLSRLPPAPAEAPGFVSQCVPGTGPTSSHGPLHVFITALALDQLTAGHFSPSVEL